MATPRAIQFAENELGVHRVYDEALAVSRGYVQALSDRAELEINIRRLNTAIATRTVIVTDDVVEKLNAAGAVSSVAALEREIKNALSHDEGLRDLNEQLEKEKENLLRVEAAVKGHGAQVQLLTARVRQVGDYLQYLASAKTSHVMLQQVSQFPY